MSKNRLLRLADDLTTKLEVYQRLQVDSVDALSRFDPHDPDSFELRAVGSILHDVYQGAESICQRVANTIDQKVPAGAEWHRLLLEQMARPLPNTRPVVIRPETLSLIEEYRGFRHVFRNIYGFELDWSRMNPLLENAPLVIDAFAVDIERFVAFLRLMSAGD